MPKEAAINVAFEEFDWETIFGLKFIRQLEEEQNADAEFTSEFQYHAPNTSTHQ